MHMAGIEQLATSMKGQNIDIQKFLFVNGAVSYDCLFSMRGSFELSMTSRGLDLKFFLFSVSTNFHISTYLDRSFQDLMSVLKTHGMSTNGFSTSRFFQALDASVPRNASINNVPLQTEIVKLRHDLEERDRPYFDTWIHWTDKGPSEANLKKTLTTLGPDALNFSLKNKASSKWSPTDLGRDLT